MKVEELINALKYFPKDSVVMLKTNNEDVVVAVASIIEYDTEYDEVILKGEDEE